MEPQKQTDPKNAAPICHESEPLPAGKLPYTGNLFKIPALLLGAFSVLLCYHLTVYALIAGILAVGFAVVDRVKAKELTSLPHVGLLCGVLGIFFSIVFFIWQ